ncbi:MAG: carbohydrate porin [Pirellulales bacterium]
MKTRLSSTALILSLSTLLFAVAGLRPVSAQEEPEEEFLASETPDWLDDSGYDDLIEESVGDDDVAEEAAERVAGGGAPAKCNCLACRSQLTGDWGGRRTCLAQKGIVYRGRVTQFFFGVGGGVNPPFPPQFAALGISGGDTFEYTGNSRHDFLISLDKFGGLPHSKFVVTMENLWGRWGNVSFETGGVAPTIFNSTFPVDPQASGTFYCTNFMLIQPLSEKFILTAGKTRTLGVADNNKFAGGDGSDQFLNQVFVANPLMVPQIPLSTFVVGAVMPQEWGSISMSVMDPVERSREFMDLGTLFEQGAVILGQVKVNTNFFDIPGEQHVGGFYKREDQLDLRFTPIPPTYPEPPAPPGTPQFLTRPETYTLYYGFDQYLVTYGPPDARGNAEGWGVFGRASIADGGNGNPNFAGWHLSAGIGGNSPLACRRGKGDRFGIGYAYTATSTEYGAIPQFLFGPRDAQNIELYYRYQLTPAIEVTPDIQWVQGMLGGLTDGDDAIVGGIRLNMKL